MEPVKNILTVSEINRQVRDRLEYEWGAVWVKGEISNFIAHSSGHWYFRLKDEHSQIKGVMFQRQNQSLSFRPQNGDEILAQGSLSLYTPRGDYQMICREMELAGSGALHQKFELLKRKLQQEGLFEESRKKPLPPFPGHIALVTSTEGAAVRDILKVLRRRFKPARVTLAPALVQGPGAPESLIKALCQAQLLKPDLIIMGRGGGSIEDLWAFNDEALARAVSDCSVPVISAVGHEIDFTLCDFVADLRAPTPSASAELAVPDAQDLLAILSSFDKQMARGLRANIQSFKERLLSLEKTMSRPDRLIQDFAQKLDEASLGLQKALLKQLENAGERLRAVERILESLNPLQIMKRGFSVVFKPDGRVARDSKELELKESVQVRFFKGQATAQVTKIED